MDGVLAPDVCNEDDTTGAEHDSWRTISCERECSRGDRLIKLSIIDFKSFGIGSLGWEDDIVGLVEKKHGNRKFSISFECETLKVDKAAEEHISNLCGVPPYKPNKKLNHPILMNQTKIWIIKTWMGISHPCMTVKQTQRTRGGWLALVLLPPYVAFEASEKA
uniref:Uncharacterized protein n=1 Tax=Oryza punctata TaxID=4537 RepID=A0A0E0KBG8_ORYPU